jgi:hypothetical protein
MPWNYGNPGGGLAGWGAPPQLHGQDINSLANAIALMRQRQTENTTKSIADSIREAQAHGAANAYISQLQSSGLIPEGPLSGMGAVGAQGAESLAKLIELERQRDMQEELYGAHADYYRALAGKADATGDEQLVPVTINGVTYQIPMKYAARYMALNKPQQMKNYLGNTKMIDLDTSGAWDSEDNESVEIPVLNPDYDPKSSTSARQQRYRQRPNPAFKDFQTTPGVPPTLSQTIKVPKSVWERYKKGGGDLSNMPEEDETQTPPAQQTPPPTTSPQQGTTQAGNTKLAPNYGRKLGPSVAPYIAGRRYAGKMYFGGDPNDPDNWERM